MQKLEKEGVILARRKSGGGCVYQDLGNSVFSFINPVEDFAKQDFKTMNNEVLIESLKAFGIEGKASGRNDLEVDGKKVSGSAYKLKMGKSDGTGKRSLHHGTMLLDLELTALGKYLNPNKKKLESKGVDSVVSRVMNLKEVAPTIDHDSYCNSLEQAFAKHWSGHAVNRVDLKVDDLKQIGQLNQIYEDSLKWEWRYGQTPDFKNSLEHKFDWALVDVSFNVEKGKIVSGQVFSDCLIPTFIDKLNEELAKGETTYDEAGVNKLCSLLHTHFEGQESMQPVLETYIPQFRQWLTESL